MTTQTENPEALILKTNLPKREKLVEQLEALSEALLRRCLRLWRMLKKNGRSSALCWSQSKSFSNVLNTCW